MDRIYDLRAKEVINLRDGVRLGYISDLFIDSKDGKIVKIIVPGPSKILGLFGKDQEYQIPWSCINKIGDDIILVDIDLNEKEFLLDC